MKSSPMCYPFDGRCRCSQDADLSLTFDDADQPLRVHSCLLKMISPVLKGALEECHVENGSIHLGKDDKQAWILLLNMVHPVSSQTLDRPDQLGPLKRIDTVGKLAMKYGADFILAQLDEVLYDKLRRNAFRYSFTSRYPHLKNLPLPTPYQQYYPLPATPSTAYIQPNLYPPPIQRGPVYGMPCFPPYTVAPLAAVPTSVSVTQSYRYMPDAPPFTPPFVETCTSSEGLDACADLISIVEHAARFNLVKSWSISVEYLVRLLRSESERSPSIQPAIKKLGTLGQQVKSMLQRLREDGYEQEALNFAVEFFNTF